MLFSRARCWAVVPLVILTILPAGLASAQTGLYLPGAGPVNRSMGGASVAAPLDGIGSLYWNPATSTALPSSLEFGAELLTIQATLDSALLPGSLGGGMPTGLLSGSTRATNGVNVLPSVGLLYTPTSAPIPVTFGLGMFPVAGYTVNYPADTTNPLLSPPPPNGVGLGSIFSNYQVLQVAPTAAVQLTKRLSVGFGPTIDIGFLQGDPLFVAPPNANGQYTSGTHTRTSWGAGFQVGAYYVFDGGWQAGASCKSPQWFERYMWQTVYSNGQIRAVPWSLNLPLIPSVGIAYSGLERWLFAADLRLINYAGAQGLKQSGFVPGGAAAGLGWNNIFVLALGTQYRVTDTISLRLGYTYNQNPIPDSLTSFNVLSSTILEHTIYAGLSYRVTDDFTISLAYLHGFQNGMQGPLVLPAGPVPGSLVRTSVAMDSWLVGASVRFGPRLPSAAPRAAVTESEGTAIP